MEAIPSGEPEDWLYKQRLLFDDKPTVAGVLLYSDNPQSILPKRSSIKVLRYQTKTEAERDFLASNPETIEGPIYDLIYDAVERVKQIIESIDRAGPKGLEKISYPEEALHELLTNAVLHRDYSVTADVQVRIFDNRVEIESPGRLPGHVTTENIAKTQFARNPKIVRLINKFKNPPNKDVGEGINTAFEAMAKLRLKKPIFEERDGSLLVTLKHESLASPEQMVMEYLKESSEITNQIARELTGIKSENSMKQVFYKLRASKQLEQVPKVAGKKPAWRKPQD
jgi:ATP-dependent DNA helicase RecG